MTFTIFIQMTTSLYVIPTYLDLCFRKLLSFILIPVVQCQLDDFKEIVWNSHRIRHQKDTLLPDGVPDHIYNFPQEYGLEECGKNSHFIPNYKLFFNIPAVFTEFMFSFKITNLVLIFTLQG